MKAKIHPAYNEEIKVVCSACGSAFVTGSTKSDLHIEVCNNCHPFYTGEQKFLDTQGRVEKFQKKQEFAQKYKVSASSKKKKDKSTKEGKSLRELLAGE